MSILRGLVVISLGIAALSAQDTPHDRFLRTLDTKIKMEQWEMQKKLQEEQLRQLKLQNEALKVEIDQARRRVEKPEIDRNTVDPERPMTAEKDFDAALTAAKKDHADFESLVPRIRSFASCFLKAPHMSARDYLEGLYALAKSSILEANCRN